MASSDAWFWSPGHQAAEREAEEDRARWDAMLAEYAEEEAEAAENAAALSVPLSLRITEHLAEDLRKRADAEEIPVSALIRRLLNRAVHAPDTPPGPSMADIEAIARRVAREEMAGQ